MSFSTSAVAVCCSRASFNSRLSRAIPAAGLAPEDMRRRTALCPLRRFRVAALWGRVLTGFPPAPERRLIASPVL